MPGVSIGTLYFPADNRGGEDLLLICFDSTVFYYCGSIVFKRHRPEGWGKFIP